MVLYDERESQLLQREVPVRSTDDLLEAAEPPQLGSRSLVLPDPTVCIVPSDDVAAPSCLVSLNCNTGRRMPAVPCDCWVRQVPAPAAVLHQVAADTSALPGQRLLPPLLPDYPAVAVGHSAPYLDQQLYADTVHQFNDAIVDPPLYRWPPVVLLMFSTITAALTMIWVSAGTIAWYDRVGVAGVVMVSLLGVALTAALMVGGYSLLHRGEQQRAQRICAVLLSANALLRQRHGSAVWLAQWRLCSPRGPDDRPLMPQLYIIMAQPAASSL